MDKKYTASVVGGGSGGRLSLNALAASDRYQLIAAADLRDDVQASLQKDFAGLRTFASAEQMFAACPTDIVCVSTYAPSHLDVTLQALVLPLKGILVEKPLSANAAEGADLLLAVKGKSLPMVVPHGLLVANHAREILRRVHNSEIGDLELVEIECDKWDIINAGIHWLNFFVMLTRNEPIDRVLAACDNTTRTYRDGMQVETESLLQVLTKSGIRCVLHSGDRVPIMREGKDILFRLIGTKGVIEFWAWESAYRLQNAEFPEGALFEVTPADVINNHQVHLENLARQIDDGKCDYSGADCSQVALELVEAAYLSSKHHCNVAFPLSGFTAPGQIDWEAGQSYSGAGGGRDGRKL